MSRRAATEGMQLVAALQRGNNTVTGEGGRDFPDLPRDPGVIVFDKIQPGDLVLAVRVKAGGYKNHLRPETIQGGQKEFRDGGAEGGTAGVRRQRRGDQAVAGRPGSTGSVKQILEARAEQNTRIVPENVLGPVTVVHVEIDHRNPFESVYFQRMGNADGDIVKEAETHGVVAGGVVPGRADVAEGILGPALHDEVGRKNKGPGRAQGRFQSERIHQGFLVERDEPLAGRGGFDGLKAGLTVDAEKLFASGARSLVVMQEGKNSGGNELVLYRPETGRTLGMTRPHVVQQAGGMADVCGWHRGDVDQDGRQASAKAGRKQGFCESERDPDAIPGPENNRIFHGEEFPSTVKIRTPPAAMSQHYLSPLFSPHSVVVIGASDRPDSVGGLTFRNLIESGFQRKLYAVNPGHESIQGRRAYPDIESIGEPVDLAVIATQASAVPDIVEACGRRGVKAAVILSAGFGETGAEGRALERRVLEIAKRYGLRLVGPNCLGVMRPSIGLNATFSKAGAKAGNLALVSQSGALCTAILDWAKPNDVGFSSILSLGVTADVDFGEILDYLESDPLTESILLYIEGIRQARRFMSALRAAARTKPVILVKVGRHEAGSKAALSHTGALVGADDVFDAAIRRSGAVRVSSVVQLFAAAKALSTRFRPTGNRLAIVTNGGGPAVMASDRAADLGLALAEVTEETRNRLDETLPPAWSHGNPVDILGDAGADRYREAVTACLHDSNVDGVLVILTPQAMTRPLEVAEAMIETAGQSNKPLLTCWMGDTEVAASREAFARTRIPSFRTPEPAVEVFSYISAYYQNQKLLMQVPGPLSHREEPDLEGARLLIENALSEHRSVLSEMESKAVLAAFRIPIARSVVARSPNEALLLAEELGLPVAMKINSPDITHKTDAGGIRLNLGNAQSVRAAYREIIEAVQANRPGARIDGVVIEPMAVKPNGRELMVGVTSDPVFGPVITFGAGGIMVEVMGDRSVALPPLNSYLVRDMIRGTRVARLLDQFRHMPPVDMASLESVLLRVSEMVCELPHIREMDINPLIVDENGAVAVDARIEVAYPPTGTERYAHLAIHPYPTHFESRWQLPEGIDLTIRPMRPEDAEIEQAFVRGLSDESKHFRFVGALQELTPTMLVRFTQFDYDREMALIAVLKEEKGETEVGVVRYAINPDGASCEFALVIADEWQHKGIGRKLMEVLMDIARDKGMKSMEGDVLANNRNMLDLVTALGFHTGEGDEPQIKKVVKRL